ncbi:universal stress protein [Rathayibacter sp. VKM Ac-2801]|uniref:universal stress protein n=1 Tax=Rathayibacter sp. VKM Ac-2801 TaxID=2609255 RepID=UPI00131F4D62|nr:universal stress protein [Rathayibacter sp. VKM Ac-2801]QHC69555.1 universal stress protein [Rathayibacter sp. VKM Ac-2801]
MPERVLVGVDGSSPSDAAVEWAVERAMRLGLDLVLLQASDSPVAAPREPGATERSLLDGLVVELRSRPGVGAVTGLSVRGEAMEQLLAASAGAGIVVVGSHKTGFLRGRVFGSRSLRLVAGATCPIAIVPEPSGRVRRGVAVGVSDSPSSDGAVRFAAREAAALGEELLLIHGDPSAAAADPPVDAASRSALLLVAARDLALTIAPALTVRLRPVPRLAAVALADAAPATVLLVLAASSGRGSPGALGRTTHDVLMNLAGPTVVVPA